MTCKKLDKRRRMLEGLRHKWGLSKTEFATSMGLSRSHYPMILAGKRSIPVSVVYILALALDIEPLDIEPAHQKIYLAVNDYLHMEWVLSTPKMDTLRKSALRRQRNELDES